jgi:pimeloyl-ACP methyl ester carboxylesterase
VKQLPVFVPSPTGAVAAVVTLPDREPRGLVVSLAGTGRPVVIGSTFCARVSERLAGHDLASVRLDYCGVGDSPGFVSSWTPSDVEAATEQAEAVVSVVSEALGVSRFAAVGTCYGSRVALSLIERPSCVGAVCLAPPILEYGGWTRLGRQVGSRRAFSFVRSNATLRRVIVVPLRRALGARKSASRLAGALAHLDRARLVFLYGTPAESDHYSERARQSVEAAVATLTPEQRARFELRMLPWGPLTNFDVLPAHDKEAVLDVVVPRVRQCFDGTVTDGSATSSEALAGVPVDAA